MNFLIAPDKFKGSLTSHEAAVAIGNGLRRAHQCLNVEEPFHTHVVTISDGGDGFLLAVTEALRASERSFERRQTESQGPLGRDCQCDYVVDLDENTAYIEMANSSGLQQLKPDEYDPEKTSTLGTGRIIVQALSDGVEKIVIGIGGSATNDAGIGIASALGYRFLDAQGDQLEPNGGNLSRVVAIDRAQVDPRLFEVTIQVVNDVTNPLFGPSGAAHMYAAQKGATAAAIERLDRGLRHLDAVLVSSGIANRDDSTQPGAGAAGGVGYGLSIFCQAKNCDGSFLLEMIGPVRQWIEQGRLDFVLTGEGKIDEQTAFGKAVHRMADLGASAGARTIAFCGVSRISEKARAALNLEAVFSLEQTDVPLEQLIREAGQRLEKIVFEWATENAFLEK